MSRRIPKSPVKSEEKALGHLWQQALWQSVRPGKSRGDVCSNLGKGVGRRGTCLQKYILNTRVNASLSMMCEMFFLTKSMNVRVVITEQGQSSSNGMRSGHSSSLVAHEKACRGYNWGCHTFQQLFKSRSLLACNTPDKLEAQGVYST